MKTIAPDQKSTKKKQKKNALVVCRDGTEYWTTQKQFWQWTRECVVTKTGDTPLTGKFLREDEEKLIVVGNTILNLGSPHHMREQLAQRRLGHGK